MLKSKSYIHVGRSTSQPVNQYKRAYLLLKELGPSQLIPYAIYQAQLRSGSLEKKPFDPCPALVDPQQALAQAFIFQHSPLYNKNTENESFAAADEIAAGHFHPFSGESAALDLNLPISPLLHWTQYGDRVNGQDIKTIWEPARFTWVFPLCQAYQIQADEKYPHTFWHNFEAFLAANPQNHGPNWSSAQEVALRLIPWLLAAQTFMDSPESTPQRLALLTQAIWQHTCRVALTLNYSRSQNNNHLLSEALGLMLGGLVFHETSRGKRWLVQGIQEFQNGILKQIESDGTYSQHSTNYHRLMLHLALLFKVASARAGFIPAAKVNQRLAQATCWLFTQMDAGSGNVPNLGHNDGSNILPLGCQNYGDYRPTVQAASRAFFGEPCLPAGRWDELSAWLGLISPNETVLPPHQLESSAVQRVGNTQTWATLRSLQFHSRPAHADLLHVDLWHNGTNLLADAGTYAYNLPDPWQNSLADTAVHNTVMVNRQDQMIRAGKFLWLERARAIPLPTQPNILSAILYCNLPIAYTQIRTLQYLPGQGIEINDRIELAKLEKSPLPVTIQFLLPDWQWSMDGNSLTIKQGQVQLLVKIDGADPADHSVIPGVASLIRAGETLCGKEANPIRGWIAQTYLEKKTALSFAVTFATTKSLEVKTQLIL